MILGFHAPSKHGWGYVWCLGFGTLGLGSASPFLGWHVVCYAWYLRGTCPQERRLEYRFSLGWICFSGFRV